MKQLQHHRFDFRPPDLYHAIPEVTTLPVICSGHVAVDPSYP